MFTTDIQFRASVIKQWSFYLLIMLTENNVNNKYAFSVYLVLILATTESLVSNTLELAIVTCYINGYNFVLFNTNITSKNCTNSLIIFQIVLFYVSSKTS